MPAETNGQISPVLQSRVKCNKGFLKSFLSRKPYYLFCCCSFYWENNIVTKKILRRKTHSVPQPNVLHLWFTSSSGWKAILHSWLLCLCSFAFCLSHLISFYESTFHISAIVFIAIWLTYGDWLTFSLCWFPVLSRLCFLWHFYSISSPFCGIRLGHLVILNIIPPPPGSLIHGFNCWLHRAEENGLCRQEGSSQWQSLSDSLPMWPARSLSQRSLESQLGHGAWFC